MRELLLIFDLNGTLVHRVKNSLEKKLIKENIHCPPHDFTMAKGVHVYLRPFYDEMIKQLPARVHIAVWTSAQIQNAQTMTQMLFAKSDLDFLLDRRHCENAPMNVKSLDVVKNMDTVFQSKTLSKNFHWNAQNTVLIDDTLTKAKKQPDNILLIPTFDVIKSTETPDDFLLRLLKWTEMVPEDFQDIRPFIKENPLTSITL